MYMLLKIIYKNFKSNIRKYILFFVSNIMAVAELFIFWGLNDVVVRAVTEPSIMMRSVQLSMKKQRPFF